MNIIKRPVISEKSLGDAKAGFYTFVVEKAAKKQEIAKAIEKMFDVKVIDTNTSNYKDEKRQQRRVRSSYTVTGFKKAVVRLKKGQKIGLFEAETADSDSIGAEVETAGSIEGEPVIKEKKSMLKGTKVKIERTDKKKKEDKE